MSNETIHNPDVHVEKERDVGGSIVDRLKKRKGVKNGGNCPRFSGEVSDRFPETRTGRGRKGGGGGGESKSSPEQ